MIPVESSCMTPMFLSPLVQPIEIECFHGLMLSEHLPQWSDTQSVKYSYQTT